MRVLLLSILLCQRTVSLLLLMAGKVIRDVTFQIDFGLVQIPFPTMRNYYFPLGDYE